MKLNNGVELPLVGLGAEIVPYKTDNEQKVFRDEYDFYLYALESGTCRLFDTSTAYGRNDEALGTAILDAGKRKEVMLMSKVSNTQQRDGDIRRAFEAHLKYLKTDYLDFYLIHWPQTGTFINTYLEMEKLYHEGLVKAIGVCNCNIHHLQELMTVASVVPTINQFELHPLFTQDALVNYCKAFDIQPLAYAPLARMHDVLINSKPIREMAKKYGKSSAQIILKWHMQKKQPVVVRTRKKNHYKEMFEEMQDFRLEQKEIYWINSLNDNIRIRYNSDYADFMRL